MLSVGYLAQGHAYERGEVSEDFFARLCQLASTAWNPPVAVAGIHVCELCRFSGGGPAQFRGYPVSNTCNRELYVPGDGIIYVAPTMVTHYVDAHEYCPPALFQQAVLTCPPMRSAAYFKALLANGARDFVKGYM